MSPKELIIPHSLIDEMLLHAKEVYPKEACGILGGEGLITKRLYRMKNIDEGEVTYMMDSKEQFEVMKEIKKEGLSMTAIYHSHPHSPAYPSLRDISLAFYPDTVYIIIGLAGDEPEINAFLIKEGAVEEIKIKTVTQY